MADENDEVIVSLPGDTSDFQVTKVDFNSPGTGGDKVTGANDDPVADLKQQFQQMQGRLSSVTSEHQQTRQELDEAKQRLQQAEGQVVTSQLDTVRSGLAAAEAEASAAEGEYVAAHESGDAAAMARAQRKMAAAEARKLTLQGAADDLEDMAKRRTPTNDQQRQPPQRQPRDPVEAFVERMSPRSAAWIREHPECVTNPKLNQRMIAAHTLALADDVAVDSDEYFRRIEEGIKPAQQQNRQPAQQQQNGDGRRPSSAAAPASGAPGGLNGGVEVRLTRGEMQSATDGTIVWNYDDTSGQNRWKKGDPIGVAEFARRKHEGMKNGLYDKSS